MQDPQQDIILKLKEANNILVTVSANPSVDQLAAAIGLTVLLNKLKKHATAVFSGQIPSTIDFLKPDETLEKNTDSLRDFIIALDKSKADKLRYKVEENIVKIFITPYKTSITQDDLDFSQGDFNVDVVLALGVKAQQDLDQAITAHGRILHDATVISVNTEPGSELGVINWTAPAASSLSELAVVIIDNLAKDLLDAQIATALLTGIVAETERFSNDKTSPETMRLSAVLMSAGANQQLVASQLEQPEQPVETEGYVEPDQLGQADAEPKAAKPEDGTLEITHPGTDEDASADASHDSEAAPEAEPTTEPEPDQAIESDHESDQSTDSEAQPDVDAATESSDDKPKDAIPFLPPSEASPHRIVTEPNTTDHQLTANAVSEDAGQFGSLPQREPELPILQRNEPATKDNASTPATDDPATPAEPLLDLPQPLALPADPFTPAPASDDFLPLSSEPPVGQPAAPAPAMSFTPPTDQLGAFPPLPPSDGTLTDIEQAVHSPHVAPPAEPEAFVDAARDAVMDAINSVPASEQTVPPKADVGATGYLSVQDEAPLAEPTPDSLPPALPLSPVAQPVPYVPEPTPGNTPADTPLTMPLPPAASTQSSIALPPSSQPGTGTPPPPPVPPPMTELPSFVNPNQP